jgi:hypothetical protein
MDHNETTIKSEAEKWLLDEQRLFDVTATEISRAAGEVRQKSIDLQTRVDQLLSDTSFQSTIEADLSTERQDLIGLTESRLRAEVEWRALRAAHGITEQATYPPSFVWHLAIILLLALAETTINAFFYENEQGLLGGFSVALGVAAINMTGALILGYWFRYKNLRSLDGRVIGWSSMTAFVLLSLYCNALFASFRSAYQLLRDPSNPRQLQHAFAEAAAQAKQVFLFNMQIADLLSFILFGLGLLLSLFAFYKGYTLDDQFPGHGRSDRAMKEALAAEASRQEVIRQKLKELIQRRRSEVQAVIHEPTQLIGQVASGTASLQHAKSLFATQTQAIQRDFALVLRSYRDANVSIRAGDPPAYYKVVPDLTPSTNNAAFEPLSQDLAKLQQELKEQREKNQEPLNTLIKALQGDATATMSKALPAFFVEVETEAKEKIDRLVHSVHR